MEPLEDSKCSHLLPGTGRPGPRGLAPGPDPQACLLQYGRREANPGTHLGADDGKRVTHKLSSGGLGRVQKGAVLAGKVAITSSIEVVKASHGLRLVGESGASCSQRGISQRGARLLLTPESHRLTSSWHLPVA